MWLVIAYLTEVIPNFIFLCYTCIVLSYFFLTGSLLDRPSLFSAITSKPTNHKSSSQQSEAGPANKERKQNLKKGKVKGRKKVHPIQSSLITHMLSQKSHPKKKDKVEDISDFPDDKQNIMDDFLHRVKGRNMSDLSEQDEDYFSDSRIKSIQKAEKQCPTRNYSKIVNDDDNDVICLMDGSCVESVLQDEAKDGGKSSLNIITRNPRNVKDSGANFDKASSRNKSADNARIIAKYDASDGTACISQTQRKSNPNLCVDTVRSCPIEMDFLLPPQLLAPFKVRTPPRVLSDTDSEIDEPESPSEVLSLCDNWLKNKNRLANDICESYNESKGVDDIYVPLSSLEKGEKVIGNAHEPNNNLKKKGRVNNGVGESQEDKVPVGSNRSSLEESKEVFKDSLLCTTRELQRNNTLELPDLNDHQGGVSKKSLPGNVGNIDSTPSHRLVTSGKIANLNTVQGKVNNKDLHRIEENAVNSSNIDIEVEEMSPVPTKRIAVEHYFEEQDGKAGVLNAIEQKTVSSTPSKSPRTIHNTLEDEISPILSSTYKKPVRTNVPLYSSTPKVNAKRLFKVDTPPLTHLSISSVKEDSQDMNIMRNEDRIHYKVNERTEDENTENEENITSDRTKGRNVVTLKNDGNCTLETYRLNTVSEKISKDMAAVSKKTEDNYETSVSLPLLSQKSKIRSKLSKFTFTEFRVKDNNALPTDVLKLSADLNVKSKGNRDDSFDLFSDSNEKNARKFPLQIALPQEKEGECNVYEQACDITDDTGHARKHRSKVMSRMETNQKMKFKLHGNASPVGETESDKSKNNQTTMAGSSNTETKQLLKTLPSGAETNQTIKSTHNEMKLNDKNSGTNILQGTIPVHKKSDITMDTNAVNFDLMFDDDLFASLSEADFDEVHTEVSKGLPHNSNVHDERNTEVFEMNTVKIYENNKCVYNELNKGNHKDEKTTFSERNKIVHKSQVNHSNPTLLGITQIIDLVDADSPEKEGKTIDDRGFDTTKNIGKMPSMTKTSKKNISTVYQHRYASENVSVLPSINLKTVKDIGISKSSPSAPQSSSVSKWIRNEEEPSQNMSQKTSRQLFLNTDNQTSSIAPPQASQKTSCQTSQNPSIDFNLLGDDELELLSESLLADTERDVQMEKIEGKIKTEHEGKSRSEHKGDGSCVWFPMPSSSSRLQECEEKEDLGGGSSTISHKSPGNLFQRYCSSEYSGESISCPSQKNPKLKLHSHNQGSDSKADLFPVVLVDSEKSVLSSSDESHVWQRKKRKFEQVVESDCEDLLLSGASNVSKTSMSTSSDNSLCIENKLKNKVSFEDDGDFVEDLAVKVPKLKQKKENSNLGISNKPRKKMRSVSFYYLFCTFANANLYHSIDEVSFP